MYESKREKDAMKSRYNGLKKGSAKGGEAKRKRSEEEIDLLAPPKIKIPEVDK
jgi:hypothetical protein